MVSPSFKFRAKVGHQFDSQVFDRCREVGELLYLIGHCRNVRRLGKSMVVFRLFEKLRC